MRPPLDAAKAMAEAARAINAATDLETTLHTIVRVAVQSLPGIDHVGISVTHEDGRGETLAASHGAGPSLDELGLRSRLTVPLRDEGRSIASLDLYSMTVDEIDAETEQLAELFAAHAGLALGHAQQRANLNLALDTRKVIGLALGMTMQRLGIDEDTAFAYLTRVSATTQRKLRDVAAAIVEQHEALLAGGQKFRHPADPG